MDKLYIIVLRVSKTMTKVVLALAILLLIYVYFLTLHGSQVEDDTETLLPDLPVAARRSRIVVDWDEMQQTEKRGCPRSMFVCLLRKVIIANCWMASMKIQ